MPDPNILFAAYPDAILYDAPGGHNPKARNHLIWGDFVQVREMTDAEAAQFGAQLPNGWLAVRARGSSGFMKRSSLQVKRVLEVNFVDVGQGDGCFVVTPEDKRILIDAGVSDNMYRFLRWRFNLRRPANMLERWSPLRFQYGIITHPDQDHYYGFDELFRSHPNDRRDFHFETLCHNGIVERVGNDSLGPVAPDPNGNRYLTDVIQTHADLQRILDNPDLRGSKRYPTMLRRGVSGGFVGTTMMLSAMDGFLPGYEADKELSIEVLGPVPEPKGGVTRLRWLGDVGKTKNGHSVLLKLHYKNLTLIFGGDLNIPAEDYLLEHYTGKDPHTQDGRERGALLRSARSTFESDFAKACHHGSADFTELFLQAVNASASVISSGDNESFSHPRPDALGAFGKYGRGRRPLIFSTELARSSTDKIRNPRLFRETIDGLNQELAAAPNEAERAKIKKKLDDAYKDLERSVAVYGMIALRTDGEKVLVAQKLEKPRSNRSKWDLYRLESGDEGLEYVSKH